MKRIAVYLRVSTEQQETAMQKHAIQQWLAAHPDAAVVATFEDLAMSGSKDARPGFTALCTMVRDGGVDAVLTYRLDRISRKAVTALQTLIDWTRQGVEFFAIDQPVLNCTMDDPFRLTKLAMFAELAQIERATLVSRTKAGIAAARARGKQIGAQRKITDEQIRTFKTAKEAGMSARQAAKVAGASKAQLYRLAKGKV
jgi:DNA invertase Pin-like site-specific DNA recombinase